jgi:hypothetical protein
MNPQQERVFAGTQLWAGANSIGGIATEKVQSTSLNLGFPAAYQSVYAARQKPLRYFPTYTPVASVWAGNNLMTQIHDSRRKEADYMAKAKVIATQHSRVRFVGTPHGAGDRPKPMLGQRHFANQNNGALYSSSARSDVANLAPWSIHQNVPTEMGHFTGGVLRSSQGQAYGKQALMDRIQQLNAIQSAQQDFAIGSMADNGLSLGTDTMINASFPQAGGIELNIALQQLIDATMAGADNGEHLSRVDMGNTYRICGMLFGSVPTLQNDDIQDILGKVDLILSNLQGLIDPDENITLTAQTREIALTLEVLFTKLRTYLMKMMESNGEERTITQWNPYTNQNETTSTFVPTDRGSTLGVAERKQLSSNLIQSLGFSKLLRWGTDQWNSLLSSADRNRLMSRQQSQNYRSGDYGVDGDGSEDDDDDRFDHPARPREDTQHDAETGRSRSERDFDPDQRNEFGALSGAYYNQSEGVRGRQAYAGEDAPSAEEGYEAEDRTQSDATSFGQREPLLEQSGYRRLNEPRNPAGVRAAYVANKREERNRLKREVYGSQASSTEASDTTFQPPSIPSRSIRSGFDQDTQGWNVYAFRDTPVVSTVSSTTTPSRASVASPKGAVTAKAIRPSPKARTVRPAKAKAVAAPAPAPAPAPVALPTKQSEVPNDLGALLRIAASANIRVNRKKDGSYGKAHNIRRNIILKLNLVGTG